MARDELALLMEVIDDSCKDMAGLESNKVKLMLYFDEAHVLARRKDTYDVLCYI
jgi:hypothetical protein